MQRTPANQHVLVPLHRQQFACAELQSKLALRQVPSGCWLWQRVWLWWTADWMICYHAAPARQQRAGLYRPGG